MARYKVQTIISMPVELIVDTPDEGDVLSEVLDAVERQGTTGYHSVGAPWVRAQDIDAALVEEIAEFDE